MAQATRTFTYSFIPAPEDLGRVEQVTRKVLAAACEGDKRITCHKVTGTPLGAVTLSMTIRARDRWWATQLAQDILNFVLWGLKNTPARLDLQSVAPAPHDHRGYEHGRRKTYRDKADSSASNEPLSDPDTSSTVGMS